MSSGRKYPERAIALPLAFSQILTWAAIFYLFPALMPRWEADLGWSKTEISGAFTAALIVSGIAAPFAGRLIDHGHGRLVLTASPALAAVLLVLLSRVDSIASFYLVWIAMGLAMAGGLYEACFAFVTHLFGAAAKRPITTITLIAGLAGTVSFPTAHALSEIWGWRGAVLAFAGLAAFLSAPLAYVASGRRPDVPETEMPAVSSPGKSSGLGNILKRPEFWLLGLSFSMIALAHGIVITHLLPLLAERDVHKETAVLAASMIGPMQVAGRLAMMSIERHVSLSFVVVLSFAFMLAAGSALYAVAFIPALLAVFVVMHGSGYGVTSITRPVVTAEFLGRTGFGAISGALAMGFMGMTAAAPTFAAVVWSFGGYDLVIVAAICAVIVGLCAFLLAAGLVRRQTRPTA